jgi:stress responsive alpha/beta barrel protein
VSEPVEQPAPAISSRTSQLIERIILANPRPDVPDEQLAAVAAAGRVLLSAIPGVEHMSFGISQAPDARYRWYVRIRFRDAAALQVYETHPNHTTYGAEQWLPIIADQIAIDYDLQYG